MSKIKKKFPKLKVPAASAKTESKVVGRPFPKGTSGNPGGRPRTPEELKLIKRLTQKELAEVGSMIIKMTPAEITALSKDPNATLIQAMVAALAKKTIDKGDPIAFDKLMDRLIGKVKDTLEVTGANGGPQVVVSLPSNGREAKSQVKKEDETG